MNEVCGSSACLRAAASAMRSVIARSPVFRFDNIRVALVHAAQRLQAAIFTGAREFLGIDTRIAGAIGLRQGCERGLPGIELLMPGVFGIAGGLYLGCDTGARCEAIECEFPGAQLREQRRRDRLALAHVDGIERQLRFVRAFALQLLVLVLPDL